MLGNLYTSFKIRPPRLEVVRTTPRQVFLQRDAPASEMLYRGAVAREVGMEFTKRLPRYLLQYYLRYLVSVG